MIQNSFGNLEKGSQMIRSFVDSCCSIYWIEVLQKLSKLGQEKWEQATIKIINLMELCIVNPLKWFNYKTIIDDQNLKV